MNIKETELPGVLIIEPKVFGDERGFFLETWQEKRYQDAGINCDFKQDNLSSSRYGVLRGLHFQYKNTQSKLVYVIEGSVYDVAVDIRKKSGTFGCWTGANLSAENRHQLYLPKGFAHGFVVTSEVAVFAYKCDDVYNADAELSIAWNDPAIGIQWPIENPILSEKDQNARLLADIPRDFLL